MNLIEHINENLTEIYEGFTLKFKNISSAKANAKRVAKSIKFKKITNDTTKGDGDIVYTDAILGDVYKTIKTHLFSDDDVHYTAIAPGVHGKSVPETYVYILDDFDGEFKQISNLVKAIKTNYKKILKIVIDDSEDMFEMEAKKLRDIINQRLIISDIFVISSNEAVVIAAIDGYGVAFDLTFKKSPLEIEFYGISE